MKLGFIGSIGGHFTQLLELNEIYEKYDSFFVTSLKDQSVRIGKSLISSKLYSITNPHKSIWKFFICFYQSLKLLLKEKPSVIITNGAIIALPICLICKFLGKKIIYIESFSRIKNRSNFGKFADLLSDLTIVQWKPLLNSYPGSKYGGPIFDFNKSPSLAIKNLKDDFIFVVMGTRPENFTRPLEEIDRLIDEGLIRKKVIAQLGHARYKPRNFGSFQFCSRELFELLIYNSDLVINGNGAGTISSCLKYRKPVILAPRLYNLGEIQIKNLDIAIEFNDLNLIRTVYDMKELYKAIQTIEPPKIDILASDMGICKIIQEQIDVWINKSRKVKNSEKVI